MSAAHSATVVYVLRAVEPAPELGLEPGEQLVVWSDGTADRVRRGTVHEGAIRRALGTGSLTLEAPDSAIL